MKSNILYKARIIIIYGILVTCTGTVYSQIISQTKDTALSVSYPVSPGSDTLFVFYSYGTIIRTGSLTAFPPQSGNFNFSWSKYNPLISDFDPPFKNEIGLLQSTVNGLSEGGYKVRVWNGSIDTVYMAWVLTDTFTVAVLKNTEGKVMSSQYTCDFITLNGSVHSSDYTYFDTLTNTPVILEGDYTFLWTSDNPDLIIPWPDTSLVSNRSFNPPYIDTWYYLTGKDRYGMVFRDSVFYESIVPKPDFTFQIFDKVEVKDFVDPEGNVEEGAPLKVRFKNESINAVSYEWVFSDVMRSGYFAGEKTQDINYQPEYSYNIPRSYYPAIIVTSEEGCIDSFRVQDPIIIKPSLLEVMNVFSPDGDSFNDYFKVRHESIKEFTIRIFNRSGVTVYKAKINNLYEWEGWDGNILNTDKHASPGAYYYVIEATGWDAKEYQKGIYTGVVYLFREGE